MSPQAVAGNGASTSTEQAAGPSRWLRGTETVTQAGERRSARIESLRAVAATAVVACHGYAFTNGANFRTYPSRLILGAGFLGVSLFFALTGFLIFLPFARRDYGDGARIDLSGYALNRALRILPLYYVVLVVVGLVDGATVATFARFAVFGENFRESLVAKALDGPMWSLVVELHFYLLLPPIAWAIARASRNSPARAAAILLVLGAVSIAVSEAGLTPRDVWTYSLPANFVYFVPGMLLALLRARAERTPPRWARHPLAGDALMAVAVAIFMMLFVDPELEFRLLPLAAVGTFLAVAACTLPTGRGAAVRLLDARPPALLGVVSYSLYLWHWPLMRWLPHPRGSGAASWVLFMASAVPVCIAAAVVSYQLFERPPLRLRRRWFPGSSAPVGAGRAPRPVAGVLVAGDEAGEA